LIRWAGFTRAISFAAPMCISKKQYFRKAGVTFWIARTSENRNVKLRTTACSVVLRRTVRESCRTRTFCWQWDRRRGWETLYASADPCGASPPLSLLTFPSLQVVAGFFSRSTPGKKNSDISGRLYQPTYPSSETAARQRLRLEALKLPAKINNET